MVSRNLRDYWSIIWIYRIQNINQRYIILIAYIIKICNRDFLFGRNQLYFFKLCFFGNELLLIHPI